MLHPSFLCCDMHMHTVEQMTVGLGMIIITYPSKPGVTPDKKSHYTMTECARVQSMFEVSDDTLCVVAVWSAVNVAGTRLQELHPDIGKPNDPENWNQVHRDVINRCAVVTD